MKRLVHYKLRSESWWLTASGIMMGLAFFLQALDFLALRTQHSVPVWQWILFMILPMVLEGAWFVLLREKMIPRAEVPGIVGGALCLLLLIQTLFCGSLLLAILGAVVFALAAATIVLITFGYIHHRALGMLVFLAASVVRVLLFGMIPALTTVNWSVLVREVPVVCVTLSMMLFFRGIYAQKIK